MYLCFYMYVHLNFPVQGTCSSSVSLFFFVYLYPFLCLQILPSPVVLIQSERSAEEERKREREKERVRQVKVTSISFHVYILLLHHFILSPPRMYTQIYTNIYTDIYIKIHVYIPECRYSTGPNCTLYLLSGSTTFETMKGPPSSPFLRYSYDQAVEWLGSCGH